MRTTEFDGRAGEMRESPWLASEDIEGVGDVTVTIEKVYKHMQAEFDSGRKKDVHAIKFKGSDKQLVLNASNRKTIVKLYGTKITDWYGKQITLYMIRNVKVGRELKNGIRIREQIPQPQQEMTDEV